jgi:hypothetical protein
VYLPNFLGVGEDNMGVVDFVSFVDKLLVYRKIEALDIDRCRDMGRLLVRT